ncbi:MULTISPECIES: hypothetical protein [Paenibacillus]|uniref:Uncharacterized protein n=1 Tax=Paenibacillus apis TaxID=1792174 RepID=A0A920CP06_9BACL|nr:MULTISPECIES: hypothetical protein [Paenibacillus]GIO43722.1 hypothetical protein J41TS4_34800 [Paenibacillus apis]
MAVTAKNGKYFYAWSKILPDGSFYLPDQALQEYGIRTNSNVILMSGRNTAKGFSVVCKELIDNSPLAKVFAAVPEIQNFQVPPGHITSFKERVFCWTHLASDHYIRLPLPTWEQFGVQPGDRLLSLRATHLAFNNLAEGPYIELAKQVRGMTVYE